ncbi:MAG TPA: NUDIX domain-containing protein [Chloroflexota bacterium]|nr:NUDIX domain-containing protein [Chloroflexota bacterium]
MRTRLFYRLWRLLPHRVQDLLVYLGAPKVTLGVSAVIRDAQGRLLLLRHTYRRPAWGLPGGLARRGEPPEEALARELHEELGTAARIGPLLHADYSVRRRHLTLYYGAAIVGSPHHGLETDAHRYAAPEELRDLLGASIPPWLRTL